MMEKTMKEIIYIFLNTVYGFIWCTLSKFNKVARKCLSILTDHNEINDIKSFNELLEFMYKPVDAASLGAGRFAYGGYYRN